MVSLKKLSKEPITYVVVAIVTGVIGIGLLIYFPSVSADGISLHWKIGLLLMIIGFIIMNSTFGMIAFNNQDNFRAKEDARAQKLESLAQQLKEDPQKTRPAWEMAQLNLEGYIDANAKQVGYIFYLTCFVMVVGFVMIGLGVLYTFLSPPITAAFFSELKEADIDNSIISKIIDPANSFRTSVLVTSSGVIMNFIGGTFLMIYKSTMDQAKGYVEMLERINAVGMSIQILANLGNENPTLKDESTAEIARELLKIYNIDRA